MKGSRRCSIIIGLLLVIFNCFSTYGQTIKIVVLELNTNQPIGYAHLSVIKSGENTFKNELISVSTVDGTISYPFNSSDLATSYMLSHIAYETLIFSPADMWPAADNPFKMFMKPNTTDLGEVVVSSSNDNMVYVAAGTVENEKQTTLVNSIYVDKYEVTVKQFNEFVVDAEYVTVVEKESLKTSVVKAVPRSQNFIDRFPKLKYETFKQARKNKFKLWESGLEVSLKDDNNWRHDEFGIERDLDDNFPVINIAKQDAERYCEFYGKRLPTANEWFLMGGEKITKGWTKEYTGGLIHQVNTAPPSKLGIHGLYGNVPEFLAEEIIYEGKIYYTLSIPNYLNELANFNFKGIMYRTKEQTLQAGMKSGFRCVADAR
jgi:hypothetical protein